MDRSNRSLRRRTRRRAFGMAAASGLLVAASVLVPVARPAPVVATSGVRIDVSPEDGTTVQADTSS